MNRKLRVRASVRSFLAFVVLNLSKLSWRKWILVLLVGLHGTEVAFVLHTQPSRVRIRAPISLWKTSIEPKESFLWEQADIIIQCQRTSKMIQKSLSRVSNGNHQLKKPWTWSKSSFICSTKINYLQTLKLLIPRERESKFKVSQITICCNCCFVLGIAANLGKYDKFGRWWKFVLQSIATE